MILRFRDLLVFLVFPLNWFLGGVSGCFTQRKAAFVLLNWLMTWLGVSAESSETANGRERMGKSTNILREL